MNILGFFCAQNTFSLSETDFGVSSYLRNRMLSGVSYKGFGLSAQSMSLSGSVNIRAANSFLRNDILVHFKDELDFLLANDYVTIDDKTIRITKKGFEYYGAVFSLFYSPA